VTYVIWGPVVLLLWWLVYLSWFWAFNPNRGTGTVVWTFFITVVAWLSSWALIGGFDG